MRQIDIYGTLGPACQEEALMRDMFLLGMTGMRLNLSHTSLARCGGWLEHFQQAAKTAGVKPKLLIDLQGPELRVGDIKSCELKKDTEIIIGKDGLIVPAIIFKRMKPGQQILLDDGKLLLEAIEVSNQKQRQAYARCLVLRGGLLKPRKSIALPGLSIDTPALTQSDRENIAVAKQYGVTGVMQPFVRSHEDLQELRRALQEAGAADIAVFAKIENMAGVIRLAELLPNADCIVIARGDLGNDMPLWELPGIQYQIGEACKAAGKPYLVVTQMLASMEAALVPTRAEVSDIFYAVWHGASAVMLTGETAAGAYPVQAMEYMCKTVQTAVKTSNQADCQSS